MVGLSWPWLNGIRLRPSTVSIRKQEEIRRMASSLGGRASRACAPSSSPELPHKTVQWRVQPLNREIRFDGA